MLKTALLILILADDGAVQLTLSEADDLASCQGSHDAVTTILRDGGYNILQSMCGETAVSLEPFYHGATPEEEIHRYRVSIQAPGRFEVAPLAFGETCEADVEGQPAIYCTRSAQAVAE